MIELLLEAKAGVESARAAGRDRLDDVTLNTIKRRYTKLIERGWAANPKPIEAKRAGVNRKAAHLLARLENHHLD